MVKVVHFADAHLGTATHGRVDPHTGLSTRMADFLVSLDAIVDTALRIKADLVIFSGDAYRTRYPTPAHQREFAHRILRLSQGGLPTVLVVGNHDVNDGVGPVSTMEIFRTLSIEYVHVVSRPDVLDIETRHGPVQVGVLPWVFRGGLLAHPKYKNRKLEEINDLLLERIEALLTGEHGLTSRLRPDVPHILAAHTTVQGAVYGSERSVMLGKDVVLPMNLAKDPAWDYVALGHIHKHQALEPERDPPVVYSGSIERIDFGEQKDAKGFVIAEVERGNCTWQFEKLDARRFVTITVRADSEDPTGQVIQAIERTEIEGTIVRVVIHVTREQNTLIRANDVRAAVAKGSPFHIASIFHDVVRAEQIRIGLSRKEIEVLTPLDMLERHLKAKEVPPERIAVLRSRAEQLLTQPKEPARKRTS